MLRHDEEQNNRYFPQTTSSVYTLSEICNYREQPQKHLMNLVLLMCVLIKYPCSTSLAQRGGVAKSAEAKNIEGQILHLLASPRWGRSFSQRPMMMPTEGILSRRHLYGDLQDAPSLQLGAPWLNGSVKS